MIGLHKNIATSYFDGIRGIAVLFVWFSHTSGRDQALTEWLTFHGIGHIGVMLFFVLSGYLLSQPFARDPSASYKSYLIRRIFRIVPLYYLVLTGVLLYQSYTGLVAGRNLHINSGFVGYL